MGLVYQTLQGQINVFECATPDCAQLIAMFDAVNDRYRENHATFYCPAGHENVYNGKTDTERRYEAQIERERNLRAQAERIREEAERRAADAEREKVAAVREKNATKRVLRNAVKTSAKLVSSKGRDRARSHKKKGS